jgi:hypothetical protein
VAAPAGQPLEALVRDELRGPVSALVEQIVRELVHERLNGTAPVPVEAKSSTSGAPSTKVCRSCGSEKTAGAFARNRRVCRDCRREQGRRAEEARVDRRREQADDDEEGPKPVRRYRLEAGIVRRLREERRAMIEAAPVELVERDGRVWQLRRLPSAKGK